MDLKLETLMYDCPIISAALALLRTIVDSSLIFVVVDASAVAFVVVVSFFSSTVVAVSVLVVVTSKYGLCSEYTYMQCS